MSRRRYGPSPGVAPPPAPVQPQASASEPRSPQALQQPALCPYSHHVSLAGESRGAVLSFWNNGLVRMQRPVCLPGSPAHGCGSRGCAGALQSPKASPTGLTVMRRHGPAGPSLHLAGRLGPGQP